MMHEIRNIDDNESLFFEARTPLEAMNSLVYYLTTTSGNVEHIVINKTESNTFLYVTHGGKTYATKM